MNFTSFNLKSKGSNVEPLYELASNYIDNVTINDREINLNGSIVFDNYPFQLRAALEDQLAKPRRMRTPSFSTDQQKQIKTFTQLAYEVIDKHDGAVLPALPMYSSQSSSFNQLDSRENSLEDFLLLGSLMLYPLYLELTNKSLPNIRSIVVVESDPLRLAATLSLINLLDFANICKQYNIGFSFLYDSDYITLQEQIFYHYAKQNFVSLHSLVSVISPVPSPIIRSLYSWLFSYSGLGKRMEAMVGTSSDELNQLIQSIWSSYAIMNSSEIQKTYKLLPSFDEHSDTSGTVFIVGGGPSLDLNISEISNNKHNVDIFAAGSSLGSLLKNEIRPVAVVLLERGSETFNSISGLINEGFSLSGITLICSRTTDPRLASLFDHVIYFHRPLSSVFSLYNDENAQLIHAGPEAVNAAFDIALNLRFSNIVLYGCDFSAVDPSNPRASNVIGDSPREFDEPVKSSAGRTVYSQASLILARDAFNASLLYSAGVHVFRVGEGLPLSKHVLQIASYKTSVNDHPKLTVLINDLEDIQCQHIPNGSYYTDPMVVELNDYSATLKEVLGSYVTLDANCSRDLTSKFFDCQLDNQIFSNYSSPKQAVYRLMRQLIFYTSKDASSAVDNIEFSQSCEVLVDSIQFATSFYTNVFNSLALYIDCSLSNDTLSFSTWDPSALADNIN